MTTPDELTKVPKDLFDRVWDYVEACDDREKHFNDLQSHYRSLASTWLLAAFGGIGFVLSTKLSAPLPWEVLVSGIAIAGALGIALLWVVDVLVYHDLLISGFIAGKQLEEAFGWLPPIRSHFGKPKRLFSVRTYVAVFYASGVLVLCGGAILILLISEAAAVGRLWIVLAAVGIVLTATMLGLTGSALKWKEGLPKWIQREASHE